VAVELTQVAKKSDPLDADTRRAAENMRKGRNLDEALNAFRQVSSWKADTALAVRSSNGIQNVMGGPGLDLVAAPRTQVAHKADLDRTALDPRVQRISGLSDDAAHLLNLMLKAHEASASRETVNIDNTAVANALGITLTQAEVARKELVLKGLIREALTNMGTRDGWVPRLPR
jgi:hypothetical protein